MLDLCCCIWIFFLVKSHPTLSNKWTIFPSSSYLNEMVSITYFMLFSLISRYCNYILYIIACVSILRVKKHYVFNMYSIFFSKFIISITIWNSCFLGSWWKQGLWWMRTNKWYIFQNKTKNMPLKLDSYLGIHYS
jgi:hypothetical protein